MGTIGIKFILAYITPLSGDEAYFVLWGQHLDFGYYDHPPMIGWFMHLILQLGHSEVLLRLPAILTPAVIGLGIYRLLKPLDENKAALIAILFLISPLNIINILVTTDTPLILFAFLSIASLFKAQPKNNLVWYALSGVFFGMAFLSKYFAVLLGLAYLSYWIFTEKNWQKSSGFILLFLASLPFALINFYWNYSHCWDNILFNLYNRNENTQFSPNNVGIFFAIQLYLITPPLIYFLFKRRAAFKQHIAQNQFKLFLFVFLIPMAIFALLSFKKSVGLHWVLAFYPALYLLLYYFLDRIELIKLVKFMAGFTALHLVAITIISVIPLESWKKNDSRYNGIVFMLEHEKIIEQIRPYEQQNFLLASNSYSPAAEISYHSGSRFFVFGGGGFYARQDDMLTDFREFKGRNILILRKSPPVMQEYTPYFDRVEVKKFDIRNTSFYLILGYGFNYESYKEGVLKVIKSRFYKIPDFLPYAACSYCDKYFPEECSSTLK
jgi:hypothetical protein